MAATQVAVDRVLAAHGWLINTSFVARLNLSLRQRVAAIRRRSATASMDNRELKRLRAAQIPAQRVE